MKITNNFKIKLKYALIPWVISFALALIGHQDGLWKVAFYVFFIPGASLFMGWVIQGLFFEEDSEKN